MFCWRPDLLEEEFSAAPDVWLPHVLCCVWLSLVLPRVPTRSLVPLLLTSQFLSRGFAKLLQPAATGTQT